MRLIKIALLLFCLSILKWLIVNIVQHRKVFKNKYWINNKNAEMLEFTPDQINTKKMQKHEVKKITISNKICC